MGTKLSALSVGLALLVLVTSLNVQGTKAVPAIRSKCSACLSFTRELKMRLEDEKPRNHLDMRHRLDEQGKRYGKLIDYKISELRAVELLDGICDTMSHYIHATFKVSESGKTAEAWIKWMGRGGQGLTNATRWPYNEEQALQKQLAIFCGTLLEEWDEELESAITGGKFEELDAVDEAVCTNMVKACPDGSVPNVWIDEPPPPPAPEAAEGDSKEAAGAAAAEGAAAAAAPVPAEEEQEKQEL